MKKGEAVFLLFFFPSLLAGQTVMGQYEEEAPLRSWNLPWFATAAGLGRADIMTVVGEDPAITMNNPALLHDLPGFSIFLNGSLQKASLFRFALVNTGVLHSANNLWAEVRAVDGSGISWKRGGWAFGLAVAITEYYSRPSVQAESFAANQKVYALSFSQDGFLRNWSLGMARRLSRKWVVGFSLNLASGSFETNTVETWFASGILIEDKKKAKLREISYRLGISGEISDGLRFTLTLEPPHRRHRESRSHYRYEAMAGKTSILITDQAEDYIHRPLIVALGGRYFLGARWQVCLETAFFNWSSYQLTWFEETENRNYQNAFRIAAALENMSSFLIFNRTVSLTTRVGLQLDPQPMKKPRSTYTALSSGFSLRWKSIRLDFGAAWGKEKGSGRSLVAFRSSLALAFLF